MRIKEFINKTAKVRLSQQSKDAHYGAGVYLVTTLFFWAKRNRKPTWHNSWKYRFYTIDEAEKRYQKEIEYISNFVEGK